MRIDRNVVVTYSPPVRPPASASASMSAFRRTLMDADVIGVGAGLAGLVATHEPPSRGREGRPGRSHTDRRHDRFTGLSPLQPAWVPRSQRSPWMLVFAWRL